MPVNSPLAVDKHNRVVVEGLSNFYINASYMKSVLDSQVYAVFAQAPLEKVYDHFWYACYRLKIKKIVMLCSFEDPHRGVLGCVVSGRRRSTGRSWASPSDTRI